MSYTDMQVLVALKMLRATGMVSIKDSEMRDLTGLKRQALVATYRNLEEQGLIEYNPLVNTKRLSSWVCLTKMGRQTAQEAIQATLASKTVNNTTLTKTRSKTQK